MTPLRPFLRALLPGASAALLAAGIAGAAGTAKPAIPRAPAPKADTARTAAKAAHKDTVALRDTLPPPLRDIGQKALVVPEKLTFDVIWGGWSFRWITAGKATLELQPGDRPEQWRIQSLAWCNKFFQAIYPVKDTVVSVIDSRGIYPLRFEKRLHEGGYHTRISATYDQKARTMATLDTVLQVDPFTHDVLSAFYYIRTLDLKVGDTYDLAAVSGKKKYNLRVYCHGRETVEVPAGKFRTLIVEPVLKGDGLFKAKGKLTIWVTDDAHHVPVKMQSKIPVGSIKAELASRS